MLRFAVNNELFLGIVYKIPILKKFFIPSVNKFSIFTNPVVVDNMYDLLKMNNNVSKQTTAFRFKDIDIWVAQFLSKNEVHIIHDIAVSNGVTSLQLLNFLKQNEIKSEFYISDKYAKLYSTGSKIIRVYDVENRIQFIYLFFMD